MKRRVPKEITLDFLTVKSLQQENMNIFYFLQSNGDKYAIEISFALTILKETLREGLIYYTNFFVAGLVTDY